MPKTAELTSYSNDTKTWHKTRIYEINLNKEIR